MNGEQIESHNADVKQTFFPHQFRTIIAHLVGRQKNQFPTTTNNLRGEKSIF